MIELKIERRDVNVELLDAQTRAVGGDLFYGVSIQNGSLLLYLSDAADLDLQKSLERIAYQHDASQLTPQQEVRLERERQIEDGRNDTPLDPTRYEESPALIQELAAKVAWLEQEMRDLRGVS